MTRQELPPLRRDLFFLAVGTVWGTFTVLTAGPWPLMLISAGTMLGPSFMRFWLLRSAIEGPAGSVPPDSPVPPSSPLGGPSPAASGAEP